MAVVISSFTLSTLHAGPTDDHKGKPNPTFQRAMAAEADLGSCPEKIPAGQKAELNARFSQLLDSYYEGKLNKDELQREMASTFKANNPARDKQIDAEMGLELKKIAELKKDVQGILPAALRLAARGHIFDSECGVLEKTGYPGCAKNAEVVKLAAEIKPAYAELERVGIKFEPGRAEWDFSKMQLFGSDFSNPKLKEAVAKLFSPNFAETLFDPNRKEALRTPWGFFPPKARGGSMRFYSAENYEKTVREWVTKVQNNAELFLAASGTAVEYNHAMKGRLWEVFGAEHVQTEPEIAKDSAETAVRRGLDFLEKDLGIRMDQRQALRDIQAAITRKDGENLQKLNEQMTKMSKTLGWTLVFLPVIVPGIVAAAAYTGVSTATLAGSALTMMAFPAVLSHTTSAFRGIVDSARGERSFWCGYMKANAEKGPDAIFSAALFANLPALSAAAAYGLAMKNAASLAPPEVQKAIFQQAQRAVGISTNAAFTFMGAKGTVQASANCVKLFTRARALEATQRQDEAYEVWSDVIKECGETALDGIFTAYGASKLKAEVAKYREGKAKLAEMTKVPEAGPAKPAPAEVVVAAKPKPEPVEAPKPATSEPEGPGVKGKSPEEIATLMAEMDQMGVRAAKKLSVEQDRTAGRAPVVPAEPVAPKPARFRRSKDMIGENEAYLKDPKNNRDIWYEKGSDPKLPQTIAGIQAKMDAGRTVWKTLFAGYRRAQAAGNAAEMAKLKADIERTKASYQALAQTAEQLRFYDQYKRFKDQGVELVEVITPDEIVQRGGGMGEDWIQQPWQDVDGMPVLVMKAKYDPKRAIQPEGTRGWDIEEAQFAGDSRAKKNGGWFFLDNIKMDKFANKKTLASLAVTPNQTEATKPIGVAQNDFTKITRFGLVSDKNPERFFVWGGIGQVEQQVGGTINTPSGKVYGAEEGMGAGGRLQGQNLSHKYGFYFEGSQLAKRDGKWVVEGGTKVKTPLAGPLDEIRTVEHPGMAPFMDRQGWLGLQRQISTDLFLTRRAIPGQKFDPVRAEFVTPLPESVRPEYVSRLQRITSAFKEKVKSYREVIEMLPAEERPDLFRQLTTSQQILERELAGMAAGLN